jgi:multiple sugar transport system permease protein
MKLIKLIQSYFSKKSLSENTAGYLFISPWILGFLLFQLIPIGFTFYASFTKWTLVNPPPVWNNFQNYIVMFSEDRDFWWSLGLTLKYVVLLVPISLIFGIALALLLNQKLKGMNFFRTIFYIPAVLSGVAVSLLWLELLNPEFGALSVFLHSIGIENTPNWLQSTKWAVPAVTLMSLWGVGGGAVIYLAGLQNIPVQLYEVAALDGANDWNKFWKITLPMLSPTIFYMFITTIIGSFQVFTPAYILGGTTRWGGTRQLKFFLIHIFMKAFQEGKLGYSSAMAIFLLLLMVIMVILAFKLSERFVYYEDGKG